MEDTITRMDVFRDESWNYFQRNHKDKNIREVSPSRQFKSIFTAYPIDLQGLSVLEIGCGSACNLLWLKEQFEIKRAVGTEPSPKVVEKLSFEFPEFEFYRSDSRVLPFGNSEFDLVIFRGVLLWVDRNYIMQSIGEAIRVSSRYLIISDFAPHLPYSTVYHHRPQYRSYKISYQPLVEATGFMRCLGSLYFDDGDEWNACQTSLFRKIDLEEAFPLRSEKDFKKR